MKNVLFLAEANNRLGMGHVSRCIELARVLKSKRVNSYFLINNNQNVKDLLTKNNFHYYTISKNDKINSRVKDLTRFVKFSCIVIDLRKKNSTRFIRDLKKICKVVVIINYISKSMFDADLMIFPEIKEQYNEKFLENKTKKLIGTKYAILNNYNSKQRKKEKIDILISMGGADKRNLSTLLVKNFKNHKARFKVKVVLGRFFTNTKKIMQIIKGDNRFSIIQNEPSLMPFMKSSKIGIFLFGITAYEALSVGLPSLVITHSKENDLAAKKISKYGCIQYLGYYNTMNIDNIPKISFSLLNDRKKLNSLSRNGRKLVDGKGSLRVTKEILKIMR